MQKNDAFSGFHPIVNLIYFALVIVLSTCLMHPLCLLLSAAGSLLYARRAVGRTKYAGTLRFAVPMMLLAAVINPAFNHEGATIVAYLPSGNPLTLESVWYGLAAAVMLFTVLIWFSSFTAVMTSDKLICLFGRIIPALSLVLTMALRFIPRFSEKFRSINASQRAFAGNALPESEENGGKKLSERLPSIKTAIKSFSMTVTWALENSVETADSMRSRGYGLEGRTSYTVYRFTSRDRSLLIAVLIAGCAAVSGALCGAFRFSYYPLVSAGSFSALSACFFAAYAALVFLPVIVDRKDDINWKKSNSKN